MRYFLFISFCLSFFSLFSQIEAEIDWLKTLEEGKSQAAITGKAILMVTEWKPKV